MNKKILALAVLVLAFPTVSSAESVYKWTDENGVTHFGDRKPTGQASESVNIRTGQKSSATRMSPQEQLEKMNDEQENAAVDERVRKVEEARQKQREANCRTARSNLSVLKSGSRVRIEENGEERYLTPEEIQEKRAEFEAIADENCGEETES